MTIKILEGVVATSAEVKRKQVHFDSESGLIKKISEPSYDSNTVDYYFNEDCLIFAGMGDVHIHAREDTSGKELYKETFLTASMAALNGGVTFVCDMPNNHHPPVDDVSYQAKKELADAAENIPILLYAGIGPGCFPLKKRKVPYKLYMGPSVGPLFFNDVNEIDDVLKSYKGEWVSFHCEDPQTLEQHKNLKDHAARRPKIAEYLATQKAIELIKKYQLKGKLCHYSIKDGLPLIFEARKEGHVVECEVTPQHLYFSSEKIKETQAIAPKWFQMNPPIRDDVDRLALLNAFRLGQIDYLATDHAPHTTLEKDRGISGLPGLDTYGSFVTWLILEQDISPQVIAKVCCENPGRFYSRFSDHQRGVIAPDKKASFTILNLKKSNKISLDKLKTKSAWSPFLDVLFPGSVEMVILDGKEI